MEAIPDATNKQLIDLYNKGMFEYPEKDKEDPSKIHSGLSFMVWGVGEESVLSDANMAITIDPTDKLATYQLTITNKTNNNLYVDLTNSFRINNDGIATPFYDGTVYSTNQGSNSGGGVNLGAVAGALGVRGAIGTLAGGVNVGGGYSSSLQVTKTDQPILVIPPHSKICLPGKKTVSGKEVKELPEIFHYAGSYYDLINSFAFSNGYDTWRNREKEISSKEIPIYSSQIKLYKNGFSEIKQSDSPKTFKYLISYSTDPNFSNVYRAGFSLFLRGIYGFKPASKSTGFSGKIINYFKNQHEFPLIWGFGTIEKGNDSNSKSSKKALKEMLNGN